MRHWLLVQGDDRFALTWDDGERLLSLSSEIRRGTLGARSFVFRPHGSRPSDPNVTIFVDADHSFELLTQYDSETSHWFG
jgi:hypothetical protein